MQVNIQITDDMPPGGISFSQLNEKVEVIMADQKQLAEDLAGVQAQIEKIGTETSATLQKVRDLEQAVIQAGQTTPAVDAAIKALKDQAQLVDDMVADPETPPSEGGETPPADGGTTPPADGTTPPADGSTTPPADGSTTPPADGGVTPATPGAPADGSAPADGAAPADGSTGTSDGSAGTGTIDRVTGQVRR